MRVTVQLFARLRDLAGAGEWTGEVATGATVADVWQALEAAPSPDPAHCFTARLLVIHEYRRIILRDPELPDELLPADWAGAAARALCRNLYRLTVPASERHLMATLETAEGPLPEAAPYFYRRFGGLPGAPLSLAG